MEKHKLQDMHRFLKQQQLLQAYVATTSEVVIEETTTSPNEVIEEKREEVDEFQDTPLEIINASLTDYVYEEASGDMTDEDYY